MPADTDKWEVRDLNTKLLPNVWYKMTITSDFEKREFISFCLEGNGVDITEDISGFPLEYLNYTPFDKPFLTFYTHALRSKEFAPTNEGDTKVYFDDMEAGVWTGSAFETVFSNGFEEQNQDQILSIPFTPPVSPRNILNENEWYFENDDAKIKISSDFSHTGNKSMECDATLVIE